jgi:hypothetical protein
MDQPFLTASIDLMPTVDEKPMSARPAAASTRYLNQFWWPVSFSRRRRPARRARKDKTTGSRD